MNLISATCCAVDLILIPRRLVLTRLFTSSSARIESRTQLITVPRATLYLPTKLQATTKNQVRQTSPREDASRKPVAERTALDLHKDAAVIFNDTTGTRSHSAAENSDRRLIPFLRILAARMRGKIKINLESLLLLLPEVKYQRNLLKVLHWWSINVLSVFHVMAHRRNNMIIFSTS